MDIFAKKESSEASQTESIDEPVNFNSFYSWFNFWI